MYLRLGFRLLGKLVLAILFAAIPVIFALDLDISMMFMGFPDSHVTDYDKAVVLPDNVLIWISLAVALYLFYRAFRIHKSRDALNVGAILFSYVILFFLISRCVDIYFVDYLHLDFGQGG
jgi:hypothetical protein